MSIGQRGLRGPENREINQRTMGNMTRRKSRSSWSHLARFDLMGYAVNEDASKTRFRFSQAWGFESPPGALCCSCCKEPFTFIVNSHPVSLIILYTGTLAIPRAMTFHSRSETTLFTTTEPTTYLLLTSPSYA